MGARQRSSEYYTLAQAAEQGQLIKVRCGSCFRTVHYLASDLAKFLGGSRPALAVPFPCSRCSSEMFMRVETVTPNPGDVGCIAVRRPGPLIVRQTWRTVMLGDD